MLTMYRVHFNGDNNENSNVSSKYYMNCIAILKLKEFIFARATMVKSH